MPKKLATAFFLLGTAIVFCGFILLSYMGLYNRYWADDWCFSADARSLGTLGTVLQYFKAEHTGYSTNRYSQTFFSAGMENTLGMFGNKLIATATIIFWLVGLVWTGYNISRLVNRIPFSATLLACSLLLYYDLYLSPQRFQILYWLSAVVPYSTALTFWFLLLGLITHQMIREAPARWVNWLVAPLAFMAAGLHETSCALMFTCTTLLLMAAWFFKRRGQAWAVMSYQTILICWFVLLMGMITLIVSPSNFRVADLHAPRSSLLAVPFVSIRHAVDFIVISLRTLPLPHVIYVALLMGLAILSDRSTSTAPASAPTPKQFALQLGITTVITYLLIVVTMAPTAYFYSSYPDPRGQSLSRFLLLCGFSLLAWFVGIWISRTLKGNWPVIASVIVLLAGFAYTARSIGLIYGDLPGFVRRAQAWDERDRTIKEAKAKGIMLVEVPAIDVAEIRTQDMFPSKGRAWTDYVYSCAARYYGVDGLKATAPQP